MSGIAAEIHAPGRDVVQVVRFGVAGVDFCVGLEQASRIIPLVQLHPVPSAPDFLVGVMNLHGECLPVIDLARRLGVAAPAGRYALDTPILVCREGALAAGLLVDEVFGVAAVERGAEQLDGLFNGGLPAFLAVVSSADGVALRLDLSRVLEVDLGAAAADLSLPDGLLDACRRRFQES